MEWYHWSNVLHTVYLYDQTSYDRRIVWCPSDGCRAFESVLCVYGRSEFYVILYSFNSNTININGNYNIGNYNNTSELTILFPQLRSAFLRLF